MKPLVTVFTPVYNQKKYIEETIESVLSQDYPNLEYIVIDDGSTDGTIDLIEKYLWKIKLLRHPNMGQYATVNKAFSSSTGEIIGIVNSDDPLLEGAVSEIIKAFEENPELIVVYPDWNMIDQDGKIITVQKTMDYSYKNMVRLQSCIPGPAAFFRRWVFEKLGGRNPEYKYIGDFDFWLRAGLLGEFKRLPKVLATFRIHPDSITVSKRNLDMADQHIRLINNYYEKQNIPDEIQKVRQEAYANAHYISGSIYIYCEYLLGIKHLLKAFLYCPSRYFLELFYIERLIYMFLMPIKGLYLNLRSIFLFQSKKC